MSLASEVLGAMITPAVLISAGGTLVLSTSNRLTRVVDRVRSLGAAAQAATPSTGRANGGRLDAAERQHLLAQIAPLSQRAILLRSALTSLYLAIGLLIATSITIGIAAALGAPAAWLPVVLGLSGATALLTGSLLLIREAQIAVSSTLLELRAIREAVATVHEPAADPPRAE